MFPNRKICDFITQMSTMVQHKQKITEQIAKQTFGFTVFTMYSFNMMLSAPVCGCLRLYAPVRLSTPMYALVFPVCGCLPCLASHKMMKTGQNLRCSHVGR